MNTKDEKSIVSVDADMVIGGCRAQGNNVASGLNSSRSTIKIDSFCIKLDIVKEEGANVQKCRHFSIRGYVAEMREKGRSNLLPFTEQLPPIEVPRFRYWLCQRCLQNCGTANTSHETVLTSAYDPICMVRPCAKSNPDQQDCDIAVRPFGEGTSGLKPALGADEGQSSQEIPAKAAVYQEPPKFCSNDIKVVTEGGLREFEDSHKAKIVNEPITSLVDQSNQLNGPPRRKARKVRLLKELLSGNSKNPQQKTENPAIRLDPKASSPQIIKRKIPQNHDHEKSIDIATPVHVGKKTKTPSKGNSVTKTSTIRDPRAGEGGNDTKKYQWHQQVRSDPVTAWRSIFTDVVRTDNQVTTAIGGSRPTYDISKARGTKPDSNLMGPPPQPDKNIIPSKKISRNPLIKSKFFGEDSRKINVSGFRAKESHSDTELGLCLSLNHDPQPVGRPLPSLLNRAPNQDDHGRKTGFFLGESSVTHRMPSELRSNEGYVHDLGNRHAPRTAFLQEQRPYTQLSYGSCSGHQKMDFSDPYKRNTMYSDVIRPHNHERHENTFSFGRSDETEIIELMAKNQYERSLYESTNHHHPPGSSNNNWIIPNTPGFHNVNMNEVIPPLHQEYLSSIPTTFMMPTNESVGPTATRNPASSASGFFRQEQVSSFFDAFSQCQKQPPSGVWISNSGDQRRHDPCSRRFYTPTNMNVLEAFSPFRNSVPFGQEYAKCLNKDKGKGIMDLDLNVVAPNVVEDQINSGALDHNPYLPEEQRISSLDSSYSNEAIPAMQLLSLMNAGKSNHSLTDSKKFSKPLSPCYNRFSPTMAEKMNPPSGSSRNFFSGPESSSLYSGSFRTGQHVKLPSINDHHVYHKPQEKPRRTTYSDSKSHGCRHDHAIQDRNERVGAHRAFEPRIDPPRTTICTINRNPADFSTPGPENEYMIHFEDLKFRKSASENPNEPKRQKRP